MAITRRSDYFNFFAVPLFARSAFGVASLAMLVTSIASAQMPHAPNLATVTLEPKAPYVDKVMDSSQLPDDGLALKLDQYNAAGWPRSWRVDYSLLRQSSSSSSESSALGVTGFIDIPNYGSASVNARLNQQRFLSSQNPAGLTDRSWRLDLRGVPLNDGWLANYSLGTINTTNTSLARSQSRISLPSAQIRGVGGQWYRGDLAEINASTGTTGLVTGPGFGSFETAGSALQTAGVKLKIPSPSASSRQDAAVQVIQGNNITDGITSQSTRGLAMSYAWEGSASWGQTSKPQGMMNADRVGGLRVQANVITSSSSKDGQANGLWADAAWRNESWRNTAGAYRFEPNLRWGAIVLASDLQGFYWRGDRSTRDWQFGASAELSDSVTTGGAGRSAFVSSSGNYRINQRNSIGAALNIRAISNRGASVSLNWLQSDDSGQSQWKGEFARTGLVSTTRLSLDRSWNLDQGTSLSTSLAREHTSGGDDTGKTWIWGVLGSWSPLDYSEWSLDAAIRGSNNNNGRQSVNANIGVIWQPQSAWSVALRYAESQGKEPVTPLLASALSTALQPAVLNVPGNRSMQILFTYTGRAGMANAPLGGAPGAGAGNLNGTVFFDANANGRRDASESGVPGVTVIVDRRYVTRTDAQGRYEFVFLAAGAHIVEISSDNIPLPWTPVSRDPVSIGVLVRETVSQDFAVQRDR